VRGHAARSKKASSHVHTVGLDVENIISDIWTKVSTDPLLTMRDAAGFPEFYVNDSGWLEASQAIFWLPPERRGFAIASSGQRIVVGSLKGALTILDLPCKPGYSLLQHGAQLKNLLQLNRIPRRSKSIWSCGLSQREKNWCQTRG
jgi:hypothetical protein